MRGVTPNNRLHRSRRSRGFILWPAPWRRPAGATPNMALQRTRAARFARIGSPLNARLFGGLLVEIVALARAEGMLEVFVLTSQSNEAACRLYARTGGRVEDDTAVLFVYPLGLEGAA